MAYVPPNLVRAKELTREQQSALLKENRALKKDVANLKEALEAERRLSDYLWRDLRVFARDPAAKANMQQEPPSLHIGRNQIGLIKDDVVSKMNFLVQATLVV